MTKNDKMMRFICSAATGPFGSNSRNSQADKLDIITRAMTTLISFFIILLHHTKRYKTINVRLSLEDLPRRNAETTLNSVISVKCENTAKS